jgi:uncharacterized protein YunC (DUF1805 family)
MEKIIKIGKHKITAIQLLLQSKSLIILRGSKGYVMCGYLNMTAANKFKDVAVKITKVTSIKDALAAKAYGCSAAAKKLGIQPGWPIKEVLKIIA